ncbi:MAG: Gfo/Idh/MocA family protein [Arachnia sp.]
MRRIMAVIGAGGIVDAHINALHALGIDVQLYARSAASHLVGRPGVSIYHDLDAALDHATAVLVATPTDTHLDLVQRVLARGLPVLCEKPLARSAEQAQSLVDAAARASVPLIPAHVVRWFEAYHSAHDRIKRHGLGPIHSMNFTRTGTRPGPSWFRDLPRSGGIVLDQMIHDIDQARWNAGEVRDVAAVGGEIHPDGTATATVTLAHVDGATSTITGTWGPTGTQFRTRFTIAGELGHVSHDSAAEAEPGTGLLPRLGARSPFQAMQADFWAWIEGGAAPRVTGADGVAAVAIAQRALASIAP